MIVLHGTWIPADALGTVGSFLFWGERAGGDGHHRRRRRREVKPDRRPHPFAAPVAELQAALGSLGPEVAGRLAESRPSTAIMLLPAEGDRPLISFLHRAQRFEEIVVLESDGNGNGLAAPDDPIAANGAGEATNRADAPDGNGTPDTTIILDDGATTGDDDEGVQLAAFSLPVLALAGADALAVLAQLPDDTPDGRLTLPKDILFWRLAATFGLDLLARQRLVPAFALSTRGDGRTGWQPLFDLDDDRARLDRLAQGLPPVCRAVVNAHGRPLPPVDDPRQLVMDFLQTGVEGLARGWLEQWPMRAAYFQRPRLATASERWAAALRAGQASIGATAFEAQTLGEAITAWTAPLVRPTQPGGFRTYFQLEEPPGPRGEGAATMTAPDPEARIWRLNFLLQSRDDPLALAPASAVWAEAGTTLRYGGQRFEQAQERLLADLGRAAKLFPPLEGGLWDARPNGVDLTTGEAYTFLKEATPLLIESGYGVTTPNWWDRRSPRLPLGMSLRLRGRGQTAASVGLATGLAGLDAIVEYDWQLALGDQELDREDFTRLVEQAVPLVQVRGYWIELRPDQVAIAQKALRTPETGIMPLRAALRLALGAEEDEQVLPVLKVIGEGWLSQLVGGDDEPVEVPTPAGFRGTLRPYQQRGLTWLSFLSDVGLGALLADDMGLGKCVAPSTEVNVNGFIYRSDELWERFAGEPWFDGEGWWAEPSRPLLVNALDQTNGQLIQAPIRRLYRQKVNETLRRITLEDGSSITITRRHKLLTRRGWTNHVSVGDRVGVPSRLTRDDEACLAQADPGTILSDHAEQRHRQLPFSRSSTSTLTAPAHPRGSHVSTTGSLRHVGAGLVPALGLSPASIGAGTSLAPTERIGAPKLWDTGVFHGTREHGHRLLDQDVFYCRIKSIEPVEHDGWVYDFEVDDHHNFVANNILCHNTVQMLALLQRNIEASADRPPVLLICPTSVVGNWRRECERFAPSLRVLVHHGGSRSAAAEFAAEAARHDLVISTYGLAYRDEETLAGVLWDGVVLDEAQNIKNPATRQAASVRGLKARYRVALTGTPVENRLGDLWSIMEFLNAGYLGSADVFRERFAIPIERWRDTLALSRLRRLVAPFLLRRLKTDPNVIADLPEKLEMKVYYQLTREQARLYESVVKDMLRQIEGSAGIQRRGLILATLTKLKQVCNHPSHYLGEPLNGEFGSRSGKVQRLREMLEEAISEGDKSLIFTQFTEFGRLLQGYLHAELGTDVLFLHGGTSQPNRERMVDRFQYESNGPPVFILSLRAGGTGLNLTAANHVFHVDRWWNPAVENQATDRAFRIGQLRNVQVHKYVCLGTLEDRIDQMIDSKKDLAEQVVGVGESWLTELSTTELREVFTLRRGAVEDE